MISPLEQQILEEVRKLTPEQQQRVLELAREITKRPPGERGADLVQRARAINFPKEDLEEIKRAIEEDLEVVEDDD